MKPLVSILIPAYNAASWVGEAIDSAISQTWPSKEIIIVDDGSTDRTLTIANMYNSRIVKVVSQESQGAAAARNKALSLSQGDYIQWLDADDVLAPNKVSLQIAEAIKLASERILMSGPWGSFIYRQSKTRFIPTPLWCDLSPVEWLIRKMGQNLHMQTATWLVNRKLTDCAGPWDASLSLDDDGEYFCRVLLESTSVCFVPDARVFYRSANARSLARVDGSPEKMESLFRSTQLHVSYLCSAEDSQRVRRTCLQFLQRRMAAFAPERPDLVKELQNIAISLGGQLKDPELGGRYVWVERLLGYGLAKRMRFIIRQVKWRLVRSWDAALASFEHRSQFGKMRSARALRRPDA